MQQHRIGLLLTLLEQACGFGHIVAGLFRSLHQVEDQRSIHQGGRIAAVSANHQIAAIQGGIQAFEVEIFQTLGSCHFSGFSWSGLIGLLPAAHAADNGIAVGAVDRNQNFADFSNKAGSNILDYVTAPGVRIYSASPGGGYAIYSGTSMATPHVSGIAALLKSHDKSLTPETIETLLTTTAENSSGSRRTSSNIDVLTGQANPKTITLDTISEFNKSQLTVRLIGSLNGDLMSRKLTIKELKYDLKSNEIIDELEVVPSTRKSLIAVDLSDSHRLDQASVLKNWLESDLFNYFELDTQVTAI